MPIVKYYSVIVCEEYEKSGIPLARNNPAPRQIFNGRSKSMPSIGKIAELVKEADEEQESE